jgi:hypothetical protein
MSAGAFVSLAATVLGAVVFTIAMLRHRPHQLAGRPTVVQLQLAEAGDRLHALLGALGADGRAATQRALRIDRAIISGYVLLGGGSSVLSIWAVRNAAGADGWRTAGTVVAVAVAVAVVVAAASDVVENRALAGAIAAWNDPPAQQVPPTGTYAAARQQHRRTSIAALDLPARVATRAARRKFVLLGAVWPAWLLAVGTICVTQAFG